MVGTFADDLDEITAGTSVARYVNDDEEFNYAVSQMEDLGHDRAQAIQALSEWIYTTLTWACANCGLEGIEVAGWAACPRCDTQNPETVIIDLTTGLPVEGR